MADILTWFGVEIGIPIPTAVAIALSGIGIIIEIKKTEQQIYTNKTRIG
jgi:hypothetical protein